MTRLRIITDDHHQHLDRHQLHMTTIRNFEGTTQLTFHEPGFEASIEIDPKESEQLLAALTLMQRFPNVNYVRLTHEP